MCMHKSFIITTATFCDFNSAKMSYGFREVGKVGSFKGSMKNTVVFISHRSHFHFYSVNREANC